MFDIRISSWNVQGGANAKLKGKSKIQYLEPHLSGDCYNIILLQEEGKPGGAGFSVNDEISIGDITFICVLAEVDPVAWNQRCTTAILVDERLIDYIDIADAEYSGVYRPLCYVDLSLKFKLRIATIHAIANESESVTQVKGWINWLDNNSPLDGGGNPQWIFMGDFNSSPYDYSIYEVDLPSNHLNSIYYDYDCDAESAYRCKLCYDRLPTQGRDGERDRYIDFLFCCDRYRAWQYGIYNIRVMRCRENRCSHNAYCSWCSKFKENKKTSYVSDHNLIQWTISV